MTDREIRDRLIEVDNLDDDVTPWEAEFIESICYDYPGPLSRRQRETAERIIDKYL